MRDATFLLFPINKTCCFAVWALFFANWHTKIISKEDIKYNRLKIYGNEQDLDEEIFHSFPVPKNNKEIRCGSMGFCIFVELVKSTILSNIDTYKVSNNEFFENATLFLRIREI